MFWLNKASLTTWKKLEGKLLSPKGKTFHSIDLLVLFSSIDILSLDWSFHFVF